MTVPTSDADQSSSTQHQWRRRERPLRLERRFEFPDYEATAAFTERAGALSESTGIFPNLSFGRTHASMTLFADELTGTLTPEIEAFAREIDALVDAPNAAE
jgi:4a-hydroxytetrahydrobiopterin dehydratase